MRIQVARNGPYLVTGAVPLSEQRIRTGAGGQALGWEEGDQYPPREKYALCRCGRSEDKPYCDGAHARTAFDGTETASDRPYGEKAERTIGPDLALSDAEDLCAGAGFCRRGEGTWELTRRSGDPEARREAVTQACECPSGRLVASDREGRAIEPSLPGSIGVVVDPEAEGRGPLWVRGGIPVESAEGRTYEVRNRTALCRCGRSANKPFCDASHL